MCVTFTSWSTPFFGMLLSKVSNRNTRVYIQYQNQFFLTFSVNCSQVVMFQIMPALCPHKQGGCGQPNVGKPRQGEGGSQKFPNLCGHPLWMTPYVTRKYYYEKILEILLKQVGNSLVKSYDYMFLFSILF